MRKYNLSNKNIRRDQGKKEPTYKGKTETERTKEIIVPYKSSFGVKTRGIVQ